MPELLKRDELLADNLRRLTEMTDELQTFRQMAERFFRVRMEAAPPPYQRKPPIGVRLPDSSGDVRIVCGPHWYCKQLNPEVLNVEVLWEVHLRHEDHPAGVWAPRRFLRIIISPKAARWTSCARGDAERLRAFDALREVAISFAADPMATLARNSTNCGCCGRALTDGQSQARGIGPECIEKLTAGWFAKKESVFERQLAESTP